MQEPRFEVGQQVRCVAVHDHDSKALKNGDIAVVRKREVRANEWHYYLNDIDRYTFKEYRLAPANDLEE